MIIWTDEFIPLPLERHISELEQKKLFAAELAKGKTAFEAALKVFPNDTNKAAIASQVWANDPEVLKEKADRIESLKNDKTFLDKNELADIALEIAEEGGKDRIAALKLYGELAGYIGTKPNIEDTVKNIDNRMTIIFKSTKENKEPKIIDAQALEIKNISNDVISHPDMTIKLIKKAG